VRAISEREIEEISDNQMPGVTSLFGDFSRDGWATKLRRECVDDETYYASPNYQQFLVPTNADDYVWSVRHVDEPRRVEVMAVTRRRGQRDFGRREVMLLKLLHDEISPLIGVRLATEEHLCRSGLSKRLNQTLSLLLEGLSEKQVAAKMRLEIATVHEYVTALYRHFRVSSRAELLAYFVRRSPRAALKN
jgi:DNA-binding CsgD family transcriptional regulator